MTVIPRLLHPPLFSDPDKTRAASLLHLMLLTIIILNIIALAVAPLVLNQRVSWAYSMWWGCASYWRCFGSITLGVPT